MATGEGGGGGKGAEGAAAAVATATLVLPVVDETRALTCCKLVIGLTDAAVAATGTDFVVPLLLCLGKVTLAGTGAGGGQEGKGQGRGHLPLACRGKQLQFLSTAATRGSFEAASLAYHALASLGKNSK